MQDSGRHTVTEACADLVGQQAAPHREHGAIAVADDDSVERAIARTVELDRLAQTLRQGVPRYAAPRAQRERERLELALGEP